MRLNGRYLFTSESVTEGHPDKVSDRISDSILDAVLTCDPNARVACETLVSTGLCVIAGELTYDGSVEFVDIARQAIRDIGYNDPALGFDAAGCAVLAGLDRQSPDIAQGVDKGGAGDQGLMFGYACSETPELMPLPIMLAHRLVRRMSDCRKQGIVDFFRPDGKSQVTVEYQDGEPVRVDTIVLSIQHDPDATHATIESAMREAVIPQIVPSELLDDKTRVLVNPTGKFVVGGPHGDVGLTGRKIIVDTYGGMAHHGGGAFSGKDPSKVDRSAAYMGRHIAKNLVAAGLCDQVEVQLAYAIGVAEPVSVLVNTFGTGKLPEARLSELVFERFDLTPNGIIKYLDLLRPIYAPTSAFGHFGRDEEGFTWESTKVAESLARDVKV